MPTHTTDLFLLEDLKDVGKTSELAEAELAALISDWKFFLDKEDWLNLWARRFGESAVHALAEELRRLPWRVGRD
jgi:hypothetical protein